MQHLIKGRRQSYIMVGAKSQQKLGDKVLKGGDISQQKGGDKSQYKGVVSKKEETKVSKRWETKVRKREETKVIQHCE